MCISNKFPGGADASDLGTTVGASLVPFAIVIRSAWHFLRNPPPSPRDIVSIQLNTLRRDCFSFC